jgi:hypothetical protein
VKGKREREGWGLVRRNCISTPFVELVRAGEGARDRLLTQGREGEREGWGAGLSEPFWGLTPFLMKVN